MQPADRDFKLAQILLNHSLSIKPKEHVLITTADLSSSPLVKAVYMETLKMGAFPVIDTEIDFLIGRNYTSGYAYQYFSLANDWQLNYIPKEMFEAKVKWADAYVRIVSVNNTKELNSIPEEKILTRSRLARPFFDKIIDADRWVLTYYPTLSMAQEAGVSYDWLVDFYYRACVVDYNKMKTQLLKIEKVLDKGKKVQITGERTNLTFSIEGRLAKAAYGERNIPDGEVFCAPVWQTVEGSVYFDLPTTTHPGEKLVEGAYLEFKNGKVVKAEAKTGEKELNKLLDADAGARALGELGIGANYEITSPMNNTLFDEKIGGTIHLALGRSYREERGGAVKGHNESVIHWDIVKDMRKKGSTLAIDGKPLLKDGKFLF